MIHGMKLTWPKISSYFVSARFDLHQLAILQGRSKHSVLDCYLAINSIISRQRSRDAGPPQADQSTNQQTINQSIHAY